MTQRQQALIAFATEVLQTLASQPEWSAATTDDIAAAAYNLNLAHNDEHSGLFAITEEIDQ